MVLAALARWCYAQGMDLADLRKRLAAAVEESGKSQAAFAAEHGFSWWSLNKFLRNGLSNPRLSTIQRYERAIERSNPRS